MEEKNDPKVVWGRLRSRVGASRVYKWVTNSALLGLVFTLGVFMYEQYKSSMQTREIVDNLMYVQKSLSTRYLGLFPDYLNYINDILDGARASDTVVIFEDVLYYGFVSKPDDFKKMHRRLIAAADSGTHVTIAYYNPRGRNFNRMILDQYVATDISAQMDMERRAMYRDRDKSKRFAIKELRSKDSALCEQYFDKTRAAAPEKFRRSVDNNRKPLGRLTGAETGLHRELEELYTSIDSVKAIWLSKDYEELSLSDMEGMYREVTGLLADEYTRHGVELIPIDENLSISCWLVGDKAILAFPSKYATDEIGFYSQDPAFSKYIKTLLNGFRGNYSNIDITIDE